jgi:hypothetical protein
VTSNLVNTCLAKGEFFSQNNTVKDEKKGQKKIWAVLTTVGLIAALGINALAINLPLGGSNTGQISDDYPSLIVPENFAFAIWGPIYLGLMAVNLLFLIGAFARFDELDFLPDIGPPYFITSLLNSLWIVCWHYRWFLLSVIVMFALLVFISLTYLRFDPWISGRPLGRIFFFRLPFGIYFGWVSVAAMGNVATLIIAQEWTVYFGDPHTWTMILLSGAFIAGIWMVLGKNSLGYATALAWALWGIYVKRAEDVSTEDLWLEWFSLLASLFLIILVLTKAILLLAIRFDQLSSRRESPFLDGD